MRPVAEEQDALRFPLNRILGTEAQVRLVRVLATEVTGPVSAPEAAELAGVTPAGARRALAHLVRTGCVQRIGRGRSQQFLLREEDPLADSLRALFRAEEDRFQEVIGALRKVFVRAPAVRLAWVDSLPSDPSEPLHLGMVAGTREVVTAAREIREHLSPLEARLDLTVELHAFTAADAPEVPWDRALLLAGAPSSTGAESRSPTHHSHREERALDHARIVATILDDDPSLRARALRHTQRLLSSAGRDMARHDLEEWRSILEGYSPARLAAFLVSDTPRARRLRQSSPFLAVLTPEERERVRRGEEGK